MYGKDSACLFSSLIREYKIPSPIKFYIPEFLNNFASKHRLMSNITKAQYELALSRIEELLPLVDDRTFRTYIESRQTLMPDIGHPPGCHAGSISKCPRSLNT